MAENSKLLSIVKGKCPRCRTGDMYIYPFYRVDKFTAMHKNCPHCNLRYDIEPGFFIGAMYISYVFSVAILLTTFFFVYNFLGDPELWVYLIAVATVIMIFLPFMFRASRVIYLYLFGGISYKGHLSK